ncbi:MAG: PilZ domain-containing protein [Candidatus Omnitrophica bacterium]|nr:PilZ domain-containing protein [Candidatus Omnitrophota bacterium]MCF7876825.1 PilZ domain-containing protein [Candidatus Omnitrophota bacterium]MCF7892976.1 PilZ domain-containing protein [Candidatus Omnitrophota bacterium]
MRDDKPKKERRKYPRLEKILPIKLKQTPEKEFDLSTQTTNISASGAYCAVSKPVGLMTKLQLTLLIPLPKAKSKKIKKIECQGVVVRKEKDKENKKFPYRIGIFFNDLDNQDRKFLQSYVNSFLK